MAKALKIAGAVVIGAGLLVATGGIAGIGMAGTLSLFGASAGTLLAIGSGITAVAGLLAKKPSVTSSQTDRLTASIVPRAFRKTWLGNTAGALDVRYEEWSGSDQDYCDWIVCHASHAIEAIDEIWINTDLAWTIAGGVTAKFAGYFSVPQIILEGTPENAFTLASGQWNGGTARLTGCAYSWMRFKVTGNSKKAESPFSGGPPSRITVIGRGAKLYDPRRDSTVPGGSGPMRANDQSTWRYTTDDGVVIGGNLPLQILFILLGWRIRNPVTAAMKLAVGSGLPAKRIDLGSFQFCASLADEAVGRAAGGTEPRYHGACVLSEGDEPKTRLDMLCAGCCGRFRDTGGKLSLALAHNDLAAAATDDGLFTEDVTGPGTWDPDPALEQTPNIVRGQYVDPSSASLYQLIDYPDISVPSTDGIDRVFPLDLGVVESPSQCQRIGSMVLQRKQYGRTFSAPFDIRAWKYVVGDIVPFTFAPLGFTRKLFRVAEQNPGSNSGCNMVLSGESADIYAWDGDDRAAVQAVSAIAYDPTRSPVALALVEAEAASLQLGVLSSWIVEVSAGIGVVAASADGTVTIDNSTRRYSDGHADVAVTGATIASGLAVGDVRSLAYDDPDRLGGVVTYQLYADDNDAHASATNPGRHYMGYIVIPETGTSTGGGGGVGGGRTECVVDTAMILMANADRTGPSEEKPASELVVGDWVWTQREVTFEWGAYQVEDVTFVMAHVMKADGYPRATSDHRFRQDRWTAMAAIGVPDGRATVARITVKIARTIITDGVLSHNIKLTEP